jgi:glycosyltransferase involved in cell wall biosynthesis
MMRATPLVTVLVTSYNRERYLAASLESVLAQAFDDFEVVVVDDASTDRSAAIARDFERRDSRVRVVVNRRNLGDYGNRNRAASLARGALLKYHDSDDLMYPHCLSTMAPPLVAEPRAGFALSTGHAWPGGQCPMLLTPRMAFQREYLGSGLVMGGPACGLIRAEVFRALGGFDERGVGSDTIFWLKACARYPVLLLPGDLFWHRVHAGQEAQSARARREYAIVPGEMWRALDDPACPLAPPEREIARRNQAFLLLKHTYHDVRAGRFGIAWLRLRGSRLRLRDWVRYARRPRRDVQAGTPLDEAGEFITPDCRVFGDARERAAAVGRDRAES